MSICAGEKAAKVAEMRVRIVLEAGNQNDCEIVLDAAQAFEEAIASSGETKSVFFYENSRPVLATLEKYRLKATTTFWHRKFRHQSV